MLRNYDEKIAILVVEGDSDVVTLSRCVDRDGCKIVVASNKTEAIEALEFSDAQGFDGVLAIVDADLVDIAEVKSGSPNVFYTDLYDLDAMVFAAQGVVERCIEALCDYAKVHSDGPGGPSLTEVRGRTVEMASIVGWLRVYSMQGNHQIPLGGFPFEAVFNSRTFSIEMEVLQKILIRKAQGDPVDEDKVAAWIAKIPTETLPALRVSQGHDLFRSLAFVVKHTWDVAVKAELWERIARSHWNLDHLKDGDLYREVVAWGERNGFHVWIAAGSPAN